MNKSFFLLLAIVITAACNGNSKPDGTFYGTIKAASGKTLYLDRLGMTDQQTLDSVKIDAEGKYAFKYEVKDISFYRIRLDQRSFAILIAEPGKPLQVDASAPNIGATYTVSNSPENQALAKITQFLIKSGESADSLNMVASQVPDISLDTNLLRKLQARYDQLKSREDEQVRRFVNENSSSLTVLALIERLTPEENAPLFEKVSKNLIAKYPNSEYAKSFEERVKELSRLSAGSEAPEIEMAGTDGKAIKLSSLRGKVVLIDFWASWCRPCRAENPNVVRVYNAYKEKGFDIFSVSLDASKDAWLKAIQDDGLIWQHHVSDLLQWKNAAARLYNVEGIPMTYLIGRDGKIIAKGLRGEALEAKLREVL